MNINGMPKDVVSIIIVGWGIVVTIILAIVFWPKRKIENKPPQESVDVPERHPSPKPQATTSKKKRNGGARRLP